MSESVGKKRRAGRKGAPREGNEPATLNGHETEIPRRSGSFAGLKEWACDHLLGGERRFLCATLGRH